MGRRSARHFSIGQPGDPISNIKNHFLDHGLITYCPYYLLLREEGNQ
jgi:hypothetical protein